MLRSAQNPIQQNAAEPQPPETTAGGQYGTQILAGSADKTTKKFRS